MPRVMHFDLSTDNPERAAQFYRTVFGWKVDKWEGPEEYWLIRTGTGEEPGITGGLGARIRPQDSTAVIIDVESTDEMTNRVLAAGGKLRQARKVIPGVGYLVMCEDTEGNTFGIMQMDETAS